MLAGDQRVVCFVSPSTGVRILDGSSNGFVSALAVVSGLINFVRYTSVLRLFCLFEAKIKILRREKVRWQNVSGEQKLTRLNLKRSGNCI